MQEYNQKLKEEIINFRKVGYQFINKEITAAEFKGVSGGMGVYAQRGGEKFMIRLRIPSGVLSLTHLKLITGYTKQYKLDTVHLTTRQAIQLHDLGIEEVCEIMSSAIDSGLYTRGGGGNFPRNVALSPLSGVDKKEAFDVTPYALLVSNYLMEKITEYHLPRKLKISFSNSEEDSGNSTINDLGFIAVLVNEIPYFQVYLAGGLGNNPAIGIPLEELVPPEEVLYHVEAVTRLFMSEGDYENKGKARLRYIPRRMGTEAFLETYKKYLDRVKSELKLEEMKPVFLENEDKKDAATQIKMEETKHDFTDEIKDSKNYLIPQKQEGLYTVVLHPLCGLLPADILPQLTKFLDGCDQVDIRLSMTESMYIRNLDLNKARELLNITKNVRQVSNLSMSVSCVGVPTCQIGVEQSQALCRAILKTLEKNQTSDRYLPAVHISGCNNSCTRHQVNALGFAGSKKRIGDKVEDVFEVHTGGLYSKDNTRFGKVLGFMKCNDIPFFINDLAVELNNIEKDFREFLTENMDGFTKIVEKYLV
ncbi:nitrite/sulfite reductase [Anaerocolumna sp. MB42-C2]|uniref:nitrite/sulfite reductase n=1 Tax=Anaerocolumna sp. MB42-C2 TaxID=3070997 RepID=UPI0027E211D1|nr:nitrite/sulfite reductase [Anaerocolumna sp. MB42-C2]WMJ87289.1 nitrite/sulfite reductase [Anaerocolumna sp. MB42-C2]